MCRQSVRLLIQCLQEHPHSPCSPMETEYSPFPDDEGTFHFWTQRGIVLEIVVQADLAVGCLDDHLFKSAFHFSESGGDGLADVVRLPQDLRIDA